MNAAFVTTVTATNANETGRNHAELTAAAVLKLRVMLITVLIISPNGPDLVVQAAAVPTTPSHCTQAPNAARGQIAELSRKDRTSGVVVAITLNMIQVNGAGRPGDAGNMKVTTELIADLTVSLILNSVNWRTSDVVRKEEIVTYLL